MLSRHWSLLLSHPESMYCNSLLAGCPKQLNHKLQKVQINSARLICQTPKSDDLFPVLHILYWLPVEQRIEYKLLLLAFKSVNNEGLSCLSNLLKFYIPSPPKGRPGMSDVSPLSGISGLSFDSTLLSPLLFFCLVLLPFLSYRFPPAGPFF